MLLAWKHPVFGLNAHSSSFLEGDVGYLGHCNATKLRQSPLFAIHYPAFRDQMLQHVSFDTAGTTTGNDNGKNCCDGVNVTARKLGVSYQDLVEEVTIQILELFARAVEGACDFDQYQHPSITTLQQDQKDDLHNTIDSLSTQKKSPNQATFVFVISAFEDFPQLKFLIQSIHLPQHLILVHLERHTEPTFVTQVHKLRQQYSNLVVLQFGTIIYPGDSLSQINLAIMELLTQAIATTTYFEYDFLFTLSAAAYPLYGATELATHLLGADPQQQPKRVRLGLLHGGDPRLCRRRAASVGLFYTRDGAKKRRVADIYDIYNLLQAMPTGTTNNLTAAAFAPKRLKQTCRRKTVSGNTAAYDRRAVEQLVQSTTVRNYFARFKQAGQCCVEESSWGAALHVIGRFQGEAALPGAMWQAWPCGMGMGNSYLTKPPTSSVMQQTTATSTTCLRMDDKSVYPDGPVELRSLQEVEQALRLGKQRGHLFARKFHSQDRYWMEWIRSNLHA